MKKILILILFLLVTNNASSNNIVYLDVQFIIDNSELGKFYKSKINKIQNDSNLKLKDREEKIKIKETDIKNKKNILSKDELEKNINELKKLINDFQLDKKKLTIDINETKKNYTTEILKILNPLLTNYVDKNGIILVMEKKNVLIGVKSLDITPKILKIINEETKNKNLLNEN